MDIITDKSKLESKKILIVDDEPINIELLEDLLGNEVHPLKEKDFLNQQKALQKMA